MRILFVLSELPYPSHRNGVALINMNILKRLPGTVEALLIIGGECDPVAEAMFRRDVSQVSNIQYSGHYSDRLARWVNIFTMIFLGKIFYPRRLNKLVAQLAAQCDLVYAAPLMCHLEFSSVKKPIFLNAVDSFSKLNSAMCAASNLTRDKLKEWFYAAYERRVLSKVSVANFVSAEDAHWVKQRIPLSNVINITNGIIHVDSPLGSLIRKKNSILFTGNFSYKPNSEAALYFAEKVLPIIRNSIPSVEFVVVGRFPPDRLRSMKNVVVTGYVEDINQFYETSSVFVCPLKSGAGVKNKILEALAFGLPIVSTEYGFQGIPGAVDGDNYLLANEPKSMADAILQILGNQKIQADMSKSAKVLASQLAGWDEVVEKYLAIFESLSYDR